MALGILVHFVDRLLHSLQFPQHVRHASVREGGVVHAERPAGVLIKGQQVSVQVVHAARAGDQGQIGRHHAEPTFGFALAHGVFHRIADLGAGENQILLDLFVGQTNVAGHAVVALMLQRVAAHAVVDEQLGAALQRRFVVGVDRRRQQVITFAAGRHAQGRQRQNRQCENDFFHCSVTLSGTGLVFSNAGRNGSTRKKAK